MLADQLCISRQTVSLWETDQTLPTIDNLLRIKEIFGVSVEELIDNSISIGEVSQNEVESIPPEETVTFKYTAEDMEKINNAMTYIVMKRPVLAVILAAITLASVVVFEAPKVIIGFVIALLFFSVVMAIRVYVSNIRAWKSVGEFFDRSQIVYSLKDDKVQACTTLDGELRSNYVFTDKSIQYVTVTKEHCVVCASNQLYSMRLSDLSNAPKIEKYFLSHKRKNLPSLKDDPVKTVSRLLVIASIASVYLALFLVAILTEANQKSYVDNLWLFYVSLPIPLASIIYGMIKIKEDKRVKKNIVVGLVLSFIICIYGAFPAIFQGVSTDGSSYIQSVEQKVEVDLPNNGEITSYVQYAATDNDYDLRCSVQATLTVDEAAEYLESITADSRYTTVAPSVLPEFVIVPNLVENDYFLLYNYDTKQYNTHPDDGVKYKYYLIMYDQDERTLCIAEFDLRTN